jgi:hypothetical protein
MKFSSVIALVALIFPTVSYAQQWRLQITDEGKDEMFSFQPNRETKVPLPAAFNLLHCKLFSKMLVTTLVCSQPPVRFGTVVICRENETTGANLAISAGAKTIVLTVYCVDNTNKLQKILNEDLLKDHEKESGSCLNTYCWL